MLAGSLVDRFPSTCSSVEAARCANSVHSVSQLLEHFQGAGSAGHWDLGRLSKTLEGHDRPPLLGDLPPKHATGSSLQTADAAIGVE